LRRLLPIRRDASGVTASRSQPPAFEESNELEMVRQTARDVASDDDGYWRDVADGMAPDEFWTDAADAGFLGTSIPEEYGGEGMGFWELSAIVEELSHAGCMGSGMLFVVTVRFGWITPTNYGTDEQKERILPDLVDGEHLFRMG